MIDIWSRIYNEIEKALHEIGSELVKDSKRLILEENIKDRGDFYRNTAYTVKMGSIRMTLRTGSNVKHEPFVLGGKEPSWTPFDPILGWVERKGLNWTDKRGKKLTPEQIAWMVIHKIKREGIPGRNVFAEVLRNRRSYVINRLNRIGAN